jgi:hypothetical protein
MFSKSCTKCGVEKLLDEFSPSSTGVLGRQSACRLCRNAKGRARNSGNTTFVCTNCRADFDEALRGVPPLTWAPRCRSCRPKECVVDGCGEAVAGWGWCDKHWTRWKRWGNPLTVLKAPDKIWTGDDLVELAKQYAGGETLARLEARFGVAGSNLARVFKRHGVVLRGHYRGGTKICNHCKIEKPLTQFCLRYARGRSSYCKPCATDLSQEFRQTPRGKATPDKWRIANAEHLRESWRHWSAQNRAMLGDGYVARILGLHVAVAKPLIPAKRAQLQLLRELKRRK